MERKHPKVGLSIYFCCLICCRLLNVHVRDVSDSQQTDSLEAGASDTACDHQSQWAWFFRRLVINNAGTLLALAAFATAMQAGPSAPGALLVAGVAVLGPYFGGVSGQLCVRRRRLWRLLLVLTELASAGWLLLLYVFQVSEHHA